MSTQEKTELMFVWDALFKIRPNAEWSTFETYASLEWLDDAQVKPTKKEFNDAVAAEKLAYSNNEYARNRELEYPTIGELTVALYDTDDKAALDTKRAAVKTKWPKDNSGPVE